MTCSVGLYLARSFRLIEQLSLFFVAMQPGLIFSWYAVRQNWAGSVQPEDGGWVGIYFNRNSLAPPAALGLLAASALLWVVLVRRQKWWFVFALTLLVSTFFDSYLLLRSGSLTSVGAIIVFGLVWLFWTVIRWWQRRKNISPRQVLRVVYPSFLLGVVVTTWLGFRFQSALLNRLGRRIDFNGREVDEKWAVIVSKLQKGKDKWKLVKLKENFTINHETLDEKVISLKIVNFKVEDDLSTKHDR